MSRISIHAARFFAFHGCHTIESKVGGRFEVDVSVESPSNDSDLLIDAVDYVELLEITRKEMSIRQNLIESVARNIIRSVRERYPKVSEIVVCVRKLEAPVSIPHAFVSVVERWSL